MEKTLYTCSVVNFSGVVCMTYPYNMGAFAQGNYQNNYIQEQNKNKGPSVFTPVAAGFIGGGAVGYYRNRYPIRNGIVSDTFASEAFNKYIDKGYAIEDKKFFKQMRRVLKKIDKITKPEKFKKLIDKNPEVTQKVYNSVSVDEMCETLTKGNVKEKAKALKTALEGYRNIGVTNMKHAAQEYWDEAQKKFVKPDNLKNDKTFKTLISTKNTIRWRKALKYGGITAGVLGALTIGYRMLLARASTPMGNN